MKLKIEDKKRTLKKEGFAGSYLNSLCTSLQNDFFLSSSFSSRLFPLFIFARAITNTKRRNHSTSEFTYPKILRNWLKILKNFNALLLTPTSRSGEENHLDFEYVGRYFLRTKIFVRYTFRKTIIASLFHGS